MRVGVVEGLFSILATLQPLREGARLSTLDLGCLYPVRPAPGQHGEIGLPGVQDEVVVVAHQAIGQGLGVEARERLRYDP